MLSERKKYNYNIGTSQSGIPTSRSRQTSSSISSSAYKASAYKASVLPLYQNENINLQYVEDLGGSQSKRILELQAANKKMLEETTKQFQKFQADVVKVQGILRIKEQQVERLQQETKELTEDKAALIQALKEKQAIIVQFHAKLRQLIQERQSRRKQSTPTSTQTPCPPPVTQSTTQTSTPTGPSTQQYTQLQTELQTYIQKYQTERTKNEQLTQQVYKLKQQVYEVSSELGLVKQQFDTYKLLQEIQEVRKS